MKLGESAKSFLDWSAPVRREFGVWRGMLTAYRLRSAWWAGSRGEVVSVSPPKSREQFLIRCLTSDVHTFWQTFIDRQAYFSIKGKPAVIVDAGANIGATAVCFAMRFPQARVYALEVEEQNYKMLQKNVANYRNIVPLKLGLWTQAGHLEVINPGALNWSFQTRSVTGTGGVEGSVECVGIKDLLRKFDLDSIDLLKIDIEGAEYEIFAEGVSGWINKVAVLAIELHEKQCPGVTRLVFSELEKYGFAATRSREYYIFSRNTGT